MSVFTDLFPAIKLVGVYQRSESRDRRKRLMLVHGHEPPYRLLAVWVGGADGHFERRTPAADQWGAEFGFRYKKDLATVYRLLLKRLGLKQSIKPEYIEIKEIEGAWRGPCAVCGEPDSSWNVGETVCHECCLDVTLGKAARDARDAERRDYFVDFTRRDERTARMRPRDLLGSIERAILAFGLVPLHSGLAEAGGTINLGSYGVRDDQGPYFDRRMGGGWYMTPQQAREYDSLVSSIISFALIEKRLGLNMGSSLLRALQDGGLTAERHERETERMRNECDHV